MCHCPPADSSVLFLNSESPIIPLTFQGSENSYLTVNLNDSGGGQELMLKTKQHFGHHVVKARMELKYEHMMVKPDVDENDQYFDDQMHQLGTVFYKNSV